MNKIAIFLFLLPVLYVSACAPTPPPLPPALPPQAVLPVLGCNEPWIAIDQHKSILKNMTFKQPIRVLEPGMAATRDYNPNRINFVTDTKGIIQDITCG